MATPLNQNQFALSNVKGIHEMRNGNERMAVINVGAAELIPGDFVEVTQTAGKVISVQKLSAQNGVIFGVVPFTFKDAKFKQGEMLEVVAIEGIVISEAGAPIARWGKVAAMLAGMKVVPHAAATTGKFTIQFVADAGTYKIQVGALTSAAIDFNDDAAAVQVAVRAMGADLDAAVVTLAGTTFSVDTMKNIALDPVSVVESTLTSAGYPSDVTVVLVQQGQAGNGTLVGRSLDIASKDGELIRVVYFLQ